jgi:hypothetical protein
MFGQAEALTDGHMIAEICIFDDGAGQTTQRASATPICQISAFRKSRFCVWVIIIFCAYSLSLLDYTCWYLQYLDCL